MARSNCSSGGAFLLPAARSKGILHRALVAKYAVGVFEPSRLHLSSSVRTGYCKINKNLYFIFIDSVFFKRKLSALKKISLI